MDRIYKIDDIYKETIWGRKKNNSKIGEIVKFEINEKQSNIINIDGKKVSLYELFKGNLCKLFFGEKYVKKKTFPFMIKFIDSEKKLSLQVHPREKKETWLFLKGNSKVLIGLKKDIDKNKFSSTELLNNSNIINIHKYNFLEVVPGTIHSIFENNLICEVQDNYDATYRFYDWNNRILTKKEFVENASFKKIDMNEIFQKKFETYKSENYEITLISVDGSTEVNTTNYCKVLILLEGNCKLLYSNREESFMKFSTILIIPNSKIKIDGKCDLLVVS